MKRIIDGQTYNVDTATLAAKYEYENERGQEVLASIYQSRGGAFFIVHQWDAGGRGKTHFEPITQEELAKIVATTDNLEVIDEGVLNPPPEAVGEEVASATLYIRIPASLKRRVDDAATSDKLSTNAWAMRCMERCLTREARQADRGIASGHFDYDASAGVVRGSLAVPTNMTGIPFTIPFAVPVPPGGDHWAAQAASTERLGKFIASMGAGRKDEPTDATNKAL